MRTKYKFVSINVFPKWLYFCIAIFPFPAFGVDCSGITTEIGNGANYISYGPIRPYLDSYKLDEAGRGRFDPSLLRPVIGAYHLDPQKVNSQLKAISDSGQKLLSIPLWFGSIDQGGRVEGFRNNYVNSSGGKLQDQQQQNLLQIIKKVREFNFETLIVRFMPQGRSSPYVWASFDQTMFDENMRFINSTIDLIKGGLDGSSIKLLLDLGGEQGGNPSGSNPAYVRLAWKQFCEHARKCSENAYFSVTPVPPTIQPRIRYLYDWIKLSGQPFPDIVAVDVYGYGGGVNKPVADWDIYGQLVDINSELRKLGLSNARLLIQETFYHDQKGLGDIRRFVSESRVRLMAIVQWPNNRQVYGEYFSRGVKQNWASEDYPSVNYCAP